MGTLSNMLYEGLTDTKLDVLIPRHRKYVGNMDQMMDFTDYELLKCIERYKNVRFFEPIYVNEKKYAGWKYTIVANNVEDAKWLYVQIGSYLRRIKVPFKVATIKQLKDPDREQAVKAITIYIQTDTNVDYLLDDLKHFLKDYKPNIKLKYSDHVWGPIWKRVDRDEFGNYIPANPNDR